MPTHRHSPSIFRDRIGSRLLAMLLVCWAWSGVARADLNQDGFTDLVVLESVWPRVCLGDGCGNFACTPVDNSGDRYDLGVDIVLDDFNGDAFDDLYVVSFQDRDRLCSGDGSGDFPPTCDQLTIFNQSSSGAPGQLGGDATPDVVVGGRLLASRDISNGGENLFSDTQACINQGNGTFPDWPDCMPLTSDQVPLQRNSLDVAVGDLNGDGWDDFVTANTFATYAGQDLPLSRNMVCLNQGGSSFHCADVSASQDDSVAVAIGDLDGDLDLDLIFANRGTRVPYGTSYVDAPIRDQICYNDGAGSFSCERISGNLSNGRSVDVALGDLNGDQYADFVVASSDQSYFCSGTESGFFGCLATGQGVSKASSVAIVQLDGDGIADLVFLSGGNSGASDQVCFGGLFGSLHLLRACQPLSDLWLGSAIQVSPGSQLNALCDGTCSPDEMGGSDCNNICEAEDPIGSADCNGYCDANDLADGEDCDAVCGVGDASTGVDCNGLCEASDLLGSPDCDGSCGDGEDPSSTECDGVCGLTDKAGSPDCDGICSAGDANKGPDCEQPPVARDDTYSVKLGMSFIAEYADNDTDANGDILHTLSTTDPMYGSISLASGGLRYTHDGDSLVSDSFDYTVSDGDQTDVGHVTVHILPLDQPPSFTRSTLAPDQPVIRYYIGADNETLVVAAANGLMSDLKDVGSGDTIEAYSDPDGGSNTIQVTVPPEIGTLSMTASTGAFSFLSSGLPQQFDFVYRSSDGVESPAHRVVILSSTEGLAPTPVDRVYQVIEDQQLIVPSAEGLGSVTSDTSTNVWLYQPPSHGSVAFDKQYNSTKPYLLGFRYTPDADFYGTDTFTYRTYRFADPVYPENYSAPALVTLEVAAVDDPPQLIDASDRELDTVRDAAADLVVPVTDVDGNVTLLFDLVPSHGQVALLSGEVLRYTPDEDYGGTDAFSFAYADENGDNATATVNVAVKVADLLLVESDGGTLVTEAGGSDDLTLALATQPVSQVRLVLGHDGPGEISLNPGSLVFDTASWNQPASVTVSGLDDDLARGTRQLTITVTVDDSLSDDRYDPVPDRSLSVTKQDDDSPGIQIDPWSASVTESGGSQLVSLWLDSRPLDDAGVTIPLGISAGCSIGGLSSVTIAAADWASGAQLTVTAKDDALDNVVDRSCMLTTGDPTSSDANYDALTAADIPDLTLTLLDDELAGAKATPASGLAVSEPDTGTQFIVTLDSQPAEPVTLLLDTPSGQCSALASGALDGSNWTTGVPVTVTATDDAVQDGEQLCEVGIGLAGDATYAALSPLTIPVQVADDDVAGILVGTPSQATEGGDNATYSLSLTSEPSSGSVTLALELSDPTQCGLNPTELVLSASDPNGRVSVTAVDDGFVEGPGACVVHHNVTAGNAEYAPGLGVADAMILLNDNDPGLLLEPNLLALNEGGQGKLYGLSLSTIPAIQVRVTLVPDDQVGVDTDTLTFAADASALEPQEVLVTAVDDQLVEGVNGIHAGQVAHEIASGDGGDYPAGMTLDYLAVNITDNDQDLDGDAIPDWWELQYVDAIAEMDPNGDLDGDGLSNRAEYQAGSDPLVADSDGDAIPDGWDETPTIADPDACADAETVFDAREFLAGELISCRAQSIRLQNRVICHSGAVVALAAANIRALPDGFIVEAGCRLRMVPAIAP